jgi:two-component system alkaline phosphatase synthesis response regulator PhoP
MQHKIMVVDDDVHVKDSLGVLLADAGFKVIPVDDELTVLDRARNESPSLIILDLMLPKIPGLELCKLLKDDAVTHDIPVIMLTARTTAVDKINGLTLGADDYVTKPFNPRELLLRINRSLLI